MPRNSRYQRVGSRGGSRIKPPGPKRPPTKIGNRGEVSRSKPPFDPSKGNNKMGLREWADTHTGKNKRSRWKHATTGENQGLAWQNRAKKKHGKDWNEVSQSDVAKSRAENRKNAKVKPKGYRPRKPEMGSKMPTPKLPGGPDRPPPSVDAKLRGEMNRLASRPVKKPRTGEDYKTFASRAGGSSAALGARFRKAKGLGMTAAQKKKLMKGATRRGLK